MRMKYTLTLKDNKTGTEQSVQGDCILASAFIESNNEIFNQTFLSGEHNLVSRAYVALGAKINHEYNTLNAEQIAIAQKMVDEEFGTESKGEIK